MPVPKDSSAPPVPADSLSRRTLLGTLVAAPLAAACNPDPAPAPPLAFVGPDPAAAHRLRDPAFRSGPITRELRTQIAIGGGGAAGLSAAWRLRKAALLFVFFDDVAWAKSNLNSVLPVTYIDINQGKPQYDICLMSLCKHHIIANSSLSWWGAWLNQYPNKLVIAPTQWFAGVEAHSHNIYPEKWIIM